MVLDVEPGSSRPRQADGAVRTRATLTANDCIFATLQRRSQTGFLTRPSSRRRPSFCTGSSTSATSSPARVSRQWYVLALASPKHRRM